MSFWQNKFSRKLLRIIDLIIVAISFAVAFYLRQNGLTKPTHVFFDSSYALIMVLFLVFNNFTFNFFDIYGTGRDYNYRKRMIKTGLALFISTSLVIFCMYLLHMSHISRLVIIIYNMIAFSLLMLRQFYVAYRFTPEEYHENEKIKTLIIGCKARARDVIVNIVSSEEEIYHIVGCLDVDDTMVGQEVKCGIRVIGTMDNYEEILTNQVIDQVLFALPLKLLPQVQKRITFAERVGINIRIMPDWQIQRIMFRPETASITFDNMVGLPMLTLSSTPKKELDLLVKSLIDYLGSLAGLLVLSPLFVCIAVVIKATSPGPVFFRQERCGLNGRRFYIYKFRTMVANAEELQKQLLDQNEVDGPVFKMKNDPRVTSVGRFLRKTSLDELPQLINVLRGQMSLVGPRPPLPAEVEKYSPMQRRRLSMKPGMTCIWQVAGRNNIPFEQWMKMDLNYIDNWSLQLDFKILFRTLSAVLQGTGH